MIKDGEAKNEARVVGVIDSDVDCGVRVVWIIPSVGFFRDDDGAFLLLAEFLGKAMNPPNVEIG